MPVEPATLDHLDRVADLWVALAAEQRDHGSHLTTVPNREVMREALAQRVVDHTCLVATTSETPSDAESIVGFVSFSVEHDGLHRDVERGVVENLYVVPRARGHGLGSELLRTAESALAAAGADRIALETLAGNEAARHFYEHRGYAPHRVTYERRPGDGKDTKDD